MVACPHCAHPTLSTWGKLNASSILPACCPSCGGLSCVSAWAHAISVILADLVFWGTVVAAIILRSWLALVAVPFVLMALVVATGALFPLRTITPSAVAAARRNARFQLFAGAAIVAGTMALFG